MDNKQMIYKLHSGIQTSPLQRILSYKWVLWLLVWSMAITGLLITLFDYPLIVAGPQ